MILRKILIWAMAIVVCASTTTSAQEPKDNPAVKLLNRDIGRHKQFLKIVAKGEGDVIFIGDSITHGWEGDGKKVWAEHFAAFKPINLGIGGDQTGHVLWRITEGKELEPIKPKLAVIMIGTNNMGGHSAEQIAGGIKAIVAELQKQKPDMKILVLGIFPRPPSRRMRSATRSRKRMKSSPSSTTARRSSTRILVQNSSIRTARSTGKSCPTCCTSAPPVTKSGRRRSRKTSRRW